MKKIYETIKDKYNNKYLFKRDISGNVIYWNADLYDNCVRTFYGRIHSSFIQDPSKSITSLIKGVNIGKSNETTDLEQAVKRLESEYKNHIKKGYKEYIYKPNASEDACNWLEENVDKTNTDINGLAQPMKCQKFKLGKVHYPCYVQPKYNGVRCICFINKFNTDLFNEYPVTFLSKEGIEYKADHLNKPVFILLKHLEELGIENPILDGELYIPYIHVTTIGGSARNSLNPYNKKLQYVVFDLSIENLSQQHRLGTLHIAKHNLLLNYHYNGVTTPSIYFSRYMSIDNDGTALEYLDKYLSEGYEGAVLREREPEYAFGQRPMFMRKLKRFIDAEFEIIDIVPYGDITQNVGTGCKIICKNDTTDGTFEVTPIGTTEYRLSLVNDKELYIGKLATVKYYERTINNLPFHANVISIGRED